MSRGRGIHPPATFLRATNQSWTCLPLISIAQTSVEIKIIGIAAAILTASVNLVPRLF